MRLTPELGGAGLVGHADPGSMSCQIIPSEAEFAATVCEIIGEA
jgi:hypothetical protein